MLQATRRGAVVSGHRGGSGDTPAAAALRVGDKRKRRGSERNKL
jgi:hypothetical protein